MGGRGKYVRANNAQVHEARRWDAGLSPLGYGRLGDAEHPSDSRGAAQLIDLFGIRALKFHASILAIAKTLVNSHG